MVLQESDRLIFIQNFVC